jgi:hypothetical protein
MMAFLKPRPPPLRIPLKERHGLWNGGAWCCLAYDYQCGGMRFIGTRAEAHASMAVFQREYPERDFRVVPFDLYREPDGSEARPTPAQWRMLDLLRQLGTLNTTELPAQYKRSVEVLRRNGGYIYTVDPETGMEGRPPIRLTQAGQRAWERAKTG